MDFQTTTTNSATSFTIASPTKLKCLSSSKMVRYSFVFEYNFLFISLLSLSSTSLCFLWCDKFYIILKKLSKNNFFFLLFFSVSCIPRMLFSGEEKINGTTYFVRVTESYGPSIKMLHAMMGHSFSLSTICLFAI